MQTKKESRLLSFLHTELKTKNFFKFRFSLSTTKLPTARNNRRLIVISLRQKSQPTVFPGKFLISTPGKMQQQIMPSVNKRFIAKKNKA